MTQILSPQSPKALLLEEETKSEEQEELIIGLNLNASCDILKTKIFYKR